MTNVSNNRKKELQKDYLHENLLRAADLAKEYKKHIIIILCFAGVVTIALAGTIHIYASAEDNASFLVARALTKYEKNQDPDKAYLEVKDDLEAVFADYSNTSAGKLARIIFAGICYNASEFDRSFELYLKSFEEFKDEAVMKNFILAALGRVCQARQGFDKAKEYFLQIEKGKTELLMDEARFALGILYEDTGDIKAGREMYRKILAKHENSIYRDMAESRLTE